MHRSSIFLSLTLITHSILEGLQLRNVVRHLLRVGVSFVLVDQPINPLSRLLPWYSRCPRSFHRNHNTCTPDYNSTQWSEDAVRTCVKVTNTSIRQTKRVWQQQLCFTKTVHLLQTRCSDHGNFNKQDLLIVPSIASKNGLFLLVMLLSVTEVSKELRINLFGETGPQTLLPSCNEHVGVEASWYHSYGSWYSGCGRYDAFASPFYTMMRNHSFLLLLPSTEPHSTVKPVPYLFLNTGQKSVKRGLWKANTTLFAKGT